MRNMSRFFLFKIGLVVVSVGLLACLAWPTYAQQPGQIIGEVRTYAGDAYNAPPYGFIWANGACYSQSTYIHLYNVIGTTFGTCGASSFKVPDLRGVFAMGSSGESSGGTTCGNQFCYEQRGATGGEYAHQLIIDEMPTHKHLPPSPQDYFWTYDTSGARSISSGTSYNAMAYAMENAGGDEAHNNVPPYLSLYYIIAYTSAYTSAAPTATPTTQPTYTPAATYTPGPTYTPAPTYTPENTQTPAATYTPEPTYTPENTQTPAATYTPEPTYTPPPPAATYTPNPTYTPNIPTPECDYPAFPAAPLIDDFNRADEGSPPSAEWGDFPGKNGYAVVGNEIIAEDGDSYSYYLTQFQPDYLEAYARMSQLPPSGPYAEYIIIGNNQNDGYGVAYVGGYVNIFDKSTYSNLASTHVGTLVDSEFGLRHQNGVLSAFYRPAGGAWSEVLTATVTITQPSYVYIWGADTAGLDDFHAGNITCQPVAVVTPDAYTHTLETGNTLYLPVVFSFGEAFVGLFMLGLGGLLTLRFLTGGIWH